MRRNFGEAYEWRISLVYYSKLLSVWNILNSREKWIFPIVDVFTQLLIKRWIFRDKFRYYFHRKNNLIKLSIIKQKTEEIVNLSRIIMIMIELMNGHFSITNHRWYDKRISYNHETSINSNQLALERRSDVR